MNAAFQPADLGDPNLKRLIVRLALPAVIGLSVNAVHHTINAFFVGMLGAEALAAVTICLPILMFVAAIGEGVGVGTAAMIGRMIGARRKGRASAAASTALAVVLPIGGCLTVLLSLFAEPLLQQFGATAESLPLAGSYLQVMAFGTVLVLLQILCDFIAIAEGNTRFSMWTLIGGFTLNIVLDPILIFAAGLGVAGAAVATILSQLVVLATYLVYFSRRIGIVRLAVRYVTLSRRLLGPIITIGLSTTLTTILTGAAFSLVYARAAELGGDDAVAALGIALRLFVLGTLPVIGFVLGAQAVLSFAHGSGDRSRLSAATRFMLLATSAFASAYGIGVAVFATPIAELFTNDAEVREHAVAALAAIHLAFPLTGLRLVLLVLLQATARPRLAALVSLSAQGYLLIPALFALPHWFGLDGVAYAVASGIGLAGLLAAILLPIVLHEPGGAAGPDRLRAATP